MSEPRGYADTGDGPSLELAHYSDSEVSRTIAEFCNGRWVAAWLRDGSVVRWVEGRPLTIRSQADVLSMISDRSRPPLRAVYATASRYQRLAERSDVFDDSNVVAVTPFWDVDNDPSLWRATVEAARAVVDELERLGVVKSVYVLWSGRGMHIRVNEGAISPEVRSKIGPLDAAWALVESVKLRVQQRVEEIRLKFEAHGLRVDNEVKPRGLFSVPLSLHRSVDSVVVCVDPSELEEFDPSWASPGAYRSSDSWRRFEPGEADDAVLRSHEVHGGYPLAGRRSRRRKEPPVDEMIRRWLDVEG
ncbi:MAG TPA: hypothetical protein ENG69_04205 [Candidatus Korarchaeota archaeon]|nr:hypothetical protein [Candidatus Korarchaeota archaeon]